MARSKSSRPTDRELTILRILWDNGLSTVRQVNEAMLKSSKALSTPAICRLILALSLATGSVAIAQQSIDASRNAEKLQGSTAAGARVVHFPSDRSLGMLMSRNRGAADVSLHWWWGHFIEWQYIGEAMGDVSIPAGKQLALIVSPGGWKDLSPLANIGPDDLDMLVIKCPRRAPAKPDDKCLSYIAGLTGLKVLILEYTDISNEALRSLEQLKSLTQLSLISEKLDDTGLSHIAELKSLKGLRFYSPKVTNAGLSHLVKLTWLEELFPGGESLGDDGLIHLAKLPKLRYLALSDRNFTDAGLLHLKNLPSLKKLEFLWPPVTQAWLTNLSKLTAIEALHINGVITDEDLAQLTSMRSLKELTLDRGTMGRGVFITDAGLAELKQFRSLESIELHYARCTDEGLRHLSELGTLKRLVIPNCFGFTDAGLSHIAKLRNLQELNIRSDGFTDAGMADIAELNDLKALAISSDSITNAGLAKLAALKSLRRLVLGAPKLTTAGLNHLSALPNVTELRLPELEQDNSLLNIAALTQLESLHVPVFCDQDLACLANLPHLNWLEITNRGTLTEQAMAKLQGLACLNKLMVYDAHLTDAGLQYVANMNKLDHLIISGDFTDQGLNHLERLKGLTYLRIISANPLSTAVLQRLQSQLPNLAEINTEVRKPPEFVRRLVRLGEKLPNFDDIKIEFSAEKSKDKMILVCFCDIEQRPSRNCLTQLAQKAKDLTEKGLIIVTIQTSKVDPKTFDDYLKEYGTAFAVGVVEADWQKLQLNWGIEALPWLILTDRNHIVRAVGFGLEQLDEKAGAAARD